MILSEIRTEARGLLQGRWTELIPVWFIFLLITTGASVVFNAFGGLVTLVIGGPLTMGITRIFLKVYHREAFELGQLFDGFKEFSRTFTAYLLITIYVFLWMLLLIVPGIIAALGYSMTFFIMAEDPNIAAGDAMRKSKEMMFGHKTELFMLELYFLGLGILSFLILFTLEHSFLGWGILSYLSLGIGSLWYGSYIMTSITIFYKRIKGEAAEEPVAQPEPARMDETVN